ncbi:Receptor-like serine/threonine-protein kinase SD1-8 [Dichanthelium oligosanthes]|uniref:Receptor-like serine/threonine-protein kinase n=1 Tax=Dichanthelium oligosanthes TaxID=888268 RepID=A0A1E5UP39_9POAL|nr:Receptor-like serine/threonine-protein kinase SD1-8 [Dichanthelium oligosanthes]
MRRRCPHLLLLLLLLLATAPAAPATDTVTPAAPLAGNRTLVSAGRGQFVLGFFAPDPEDAGRTYLGIWFNNIPVRTVVWVANRGSPVPGAPADAALRVLANGSLAIVDNNDSDDNAVVWATPPPPASSTSAPANATAQLLENGNLVLRVPGAGVVWQSFDYPTDTLLPGMKLGIDFRTGLDRRMNSWRGAGDPSPGEYTFRLDPRGSPELFLYRWSARTYGSGPWNGFQFSGVPNLKSNSLLTFRFVSDPGREAYYSYGIVDSATVLTRFVINSSGQIQRLMWIDMTRSWSLFWSYPLDECDGYRACGPYGVCSVERSPICACAPGFDPRFPAEWALRDGSGGCRRRTGLNCTGDGFATLTNMKLPESANATVDMSLGLDECRQACLRDCACRAYASANVSSTEATGCFMWTGDLLDMRQFGNGGQNLFVRLAASDLPLSTSSAETHSQTTRLVEIIVPSVVGSVLLLVGLYICVMKVKKRRKEAAPLPSRNAQSTPFGRRNQIAASSDAQDDSLHNGHHQGNNKDCDLPSFDAEKIQAATNNFSIHNKIGQGGFGPVYMGKLENGQDIAVKRLSRRSTQGLREFKNEVKLIAKLQHRNLVRLLGCCIDGYERMLVYEYMHNRSLNTFLFNEERQSMLSWEKRFNIINGIARGILYLHQDSVLRIIHRDLKASNILLDKDMNPKISDFGVARIFGTDQTAAYTKKVVGTYGYMSPEYAMDGVFSMKSDVFSFGVLVLEIVSGKKNRGFYHTELDLNLLRYAWRLWRNGESLEFIDQSIADTSNAMEVLKCIQIGLLCVQEQPKRRPTMSSVTTMLTSENPTLPEPCEPAFCMGRNHDDDDDNDEDPEAKACRSDSASSWTVTVVDGR